MERWKKLLAMVLAVAVTLSCAPWYSLEAKAEAAGDFEYEVNEDGNSVSIKKYKGSGGAVEIPAEIEGKKVTSIGGFNGCNSITSIKIPSGVTSIGIRAFRSCSSLASVEIPSGVTDIGFQAFYGCSSLASVEIPSGVTSIGINAFGHCIGLTSVEIPSGVTSIEPDTFSGCSSLTSVKIPSSVTKIGMYAFSGCSSLVKVEIPSGVTNIGNNAFMGCGGLTSITVEEGNAKYDSRNSCNAIIKTDSNALIVGCKNTEIPSSVTSIEGDAFSGRVGLTRVEIPSGVTSIGSTAFSGCIGLTSITVEEGNAEYDSRDNCNAIIETDSNTLIVGCKNTEIPSSVTRIGNYAFHECSSLMRVEIPSSVTDIGERAFYGCSSLASVEIPSGVTRIGDYAFHGCSGLTSITVEEGNTGYDSRNNCNAIIETDSNALIVGCEGTVIPDGVMNIREEAFYGCIGLTSVEIPLSVTDIGNYAFYGCSSLMSVGIPSSVTKIGSSAFYGCSSLMSVEIPSSVTDIEGSAFGYDSDGEEIPGFIIYGKKGSEAERYAQENGLTFRLSEGGSTQETDISKASVVLEKNSYTYDGTAKTPSVTVKLDGGTLVLNTDYTVSYSNNINIGTAKVTVSGKGIYSGSKSVGFAIVQAAGQGPGITCRKTVYKAVYGAKPFKISASSKNKLTYTSSNPKVASVDKGSGKVTIKNTGVAIITLKAGKTVKKVTVKVSPKKPSVKSAKAVKGRKLAVKWAKDKKASGYQVQVGTDKKFKKGVKTKKLPKTSYTFTKLIKGKKYYVRLRSYKKSGKETLYSAWSNAKVSGKVKK